MYAMYNAYAIAFVRTTRLSYRANEIDGERIIMYKTGKLL